MTTKTKTEIRKLVSRKEWQTALVYERLENALSNLYHNATPHHPYLSDEHEANAYSAWFQGAAEFELEYVSSGGAYGDYRKTAKFMFDKALSEGKSVAYAGRLSRNYISNVREALSRCNKLDSRQHAINAMYERITDYGKLHTWGRGGRTLAPDHLVKERGGSSFSIRDSEDVAEGMNYADVIKLIQILESFNSYVKSWCSKPNLTYLWQEEKENNPVILEEMYKDDTSTE